MTKEERLAKLLTYRYAHRGLHRKPEIPENSMAAFSRAVEAGYAIELDIHLTADNRMAVIHDSNLTRTAGADLIIEDITLEEAQSHPLEESDERIPAFEDVLEMVAGRVPILVEIKAGKRADGTYATRDLCREATQRLDAYVERYPGALYCIESFSPVAVYWLGKHRPDVVRGQLAEIFNKRRGRFLTWGEDLLVRNLLVYRIGCPDFVSFCFRDRALVDLNRYRKPLFLWTLRCQEDVETAERMGAAPIFEGFEPSMT